MVDNILNKIELLLETGDEQNIYDFLLALRELLESSLLTDIPILRMYRLNRIAEYLEQLQEVDPDMLYYAEKMIDRYLTYIQ